MKQIYYVIQALIHGRGANIIKVVSLGLGQIGRASCRERV